MLKTIAQAALKAFLVGLSKGGVPAGLIAVATVVGAYYSGYFN